MVFRRFVVVPIFLAVLAVLGSGQYEATSAESPRSSEERLDSRLLTLADAFDSGGSAVAREKARSFGLKANADHVQVIVEVGVDGNFDSAIEALGGIEEAKSGDLIQMRVPFGALRDISNTPGVVRVRPPLKAILSVTSEGVGLTGANTWHAQGLTGAGVKVAVLDLGFQGFQGKLGTELPASVTTMSFRADADITGGGVVHGTGVAEIVHDMAPDAELYLVNFDTEVELENAGTWLTEQGVQVINASWGYFVSGPGDGTGLVNDVITTSIANGAFWSISAANHAMKHWTGTFTDTDANGWHEYSGPNDEGNVIVGSFLGYMFPGEAMTVELKWDDPWGSACRDYDLYIVRPDGPDPDNDPEVVGGSENEQNDGLNCVPGAEPWESVTATATALDLHYAVIKEFASSSDANLHLYSHIHDLDYQVPAGSLGQPADNANALTLGAVNWGSPSTIEPFSSRGPTDDGRTKPDVVAPDGVSSTTYPTGFAGTSAAAPHAAGAAALVLQRSPCLDPAGLKTFLMANTVDLGTPGADNTFGAGRLLLGAPPNDADADGPSDDCDNCPNWANPGQALPAFPVPPNDADCDGFTAAVESHVVTDPLVHCNGDSTPNNEPDAWPTDFNDDRFTNLPDVISFGPTFNKLEGQPGYNQRYDLNVSDQVLLSDVILMGAFFNKTCD